MIEICTAHREEHKAILFVALSHPCTRDFGNHMFSGEDAYRKGWIRVAVADGEILGFTCVRHKVRTPVTELYFIGVHEDHRRDGIGELLMADLWEQSPHPTIGLNCLKTNKPAVFFYRKHGFALVGDSLKGKGWRYEKTR